MGLLAFITVLFCALTADPINAVRNQGLTWSNYDFMENELSNFEGNTQINSNSGKKPPSLSCVLFGDFGCQRICDFECRLYGCTTKATCTNGLYCKCNEVYVYSSTRDVSVDQFTTMPLDELWYFRFTKDEWSTGALNKIKADSNMKESVETLLRNPHQTSEELRKILLQMFPNLNELENVLAIDHGEKGYLVDENGELEYNNLGQYFQDLYRRIKEGASRAKYRIRFRKMVRKIGSEEELKYVKRQIDATGNEKLKLLVDKYLRNRGITINEDEDIAFQPRKRCIQRRNRNRNRRRNRKSSPSRFPLEQPPTIKHVTLNNAGNPVTLDADEDRIVELSLINEMVNAADAGKVPQTEKQPENSPGSPRKRKPDNPHVHNQIPVSSNYIPQNGDDIQEIVQPQKKPENYKYPAMSGRPDSSSQGFGNSNNGQYFGDDIKGRPKLNKGFKNQNQEQFSKNENLPQNSFPVSSGFPQGPSQGFGSNNFGDNFGDSIRKNIEDKMSKQQEELEKAANEENPDENVHTTYSFNSVSNNVLATDVDGKETMIQTAAVKNMHKDSDHPEENTNTEFDLDALSLKDPKQNKNMKFVETKDSDKLKGTTQVKDQLKDGDKEVIYVHDDNDNLLMSPTDSTQSKTSQMSKSSDSQMPPENFKNQSNSKYYLVIDDDGQVVHTESGANQDQINDLMKKYPGYVIEP